MAERCENCKFWNEAGFADGQCRNHPPGGPFPWIDGAGVNMIDIWPHTKSKEWCGYFTEKRELSPIPFNNL